MDSKKEIIKTNLWLNFLIIPIEILADTSLSVREKLLFGLIQAMNYTSKGCFASNHYLGLILDVEAQSIKIGIRKLKNKNYLSSTIINNKRILKIDINYNKMGRKNTHNLFKKLQNYEQNWGGKKIPSGGVKKYPHKSIIEKDVISKEINKEPNGSPVIEESFFLKRWNILPNIRKHKIGSKIYLRANKYSQDLIQGNYHKKIFNKNFLQKNNIPENFLTKKWSQKEIIEGLRRLSKLFTDGYWPVDKTNIPPDLANLLYNPNKQTSFFLLVMNKEPQLLKREIIDSNPIITKMFVDSLNLHKEFNNGKQKILIDGIKSIINIWGELSSTNDIDFQFKYPSKNKLCSDYIDFIKEQEWLNKPNINIINTNSKVWEMFKNKIKEDIEL